MAESPAISMRQATKRYGRTLAVDDLNLEVRQGEVFGFVGENAAGKTTTIRLLMGHAKPDSGTVDVLGENPRDEQRAHLLMARIGYVSETRSMYDWMRVREIIGFCAALRGARWDSVYAESLRDAYGLDPQAQVRHLSRGKRALLMLLLAVAHRPELLILDEPSSGLDPVARHEMLEHVIATVQSDGRTVFFSSHLLDEVERVSNRIGFMHKGRLVTAEPLDDLRRRWRRMRVMWPEAREVPAVSGICRTERRGRELILVLNRFHEGVPHEIAALGATEIAAEPMSLDDIFLETVRRQN